MSDKKSIGLKEAIYIFIFILNYYLKLSKHSNILSGKYNQGNINHYLVASTNTNCWITVYNWNKLC